MFGRKAYQGKMEEQLRQIGAKLDGLIQKGIDAKADAKTEVDRQAKALRAKYEDAQKKLQQVKESSDEAWEGFKHGADKAWGELKTAWDAAAAKIKK